jgi:hypothetical protein
VNVRKREPTLLYGEGPDRWLQIVTAVTVQQPVAIYRKHWQLRQVPQRAVSAASAALTSRAAGVRRNGIDDLRPEGDR